MADVNNATFSGRLVRDAEAKTLPNAAATQLVTFDIACNTGFGNNEKVLYVTVNLWGKTGQGVKPYLVKGKQVAVWGQLELQRWTSKEGQNQSKVVLSCNNIVLLGGGSSDKQATMGTIPTATAIENTEYSIVSYDDEIVF